MKMTKKVLSVLLSLMLVLGAVAVGGMSASADGEATVNYGTPRGSYICQYKLGDTYGDGWYGSYILIEYLGYTLKLGRVNYGGARPYEPSDPDSMDSGYILFPSMCDDPDGYDIEVSWVNGGHNYDDEVIFDLSFPDGSNLHVENPVPGELGTYHVDTTPGTSTDYAVFKVAAMDSMLDGWYGGAVEIYQEGRSEPFTRVVNNDGEARTENDILLPSGYTYEFRWMKDRDNSECSVEVTDDKGNTCSVENPDAGLLWSFYVPYKTGNRLYYGTYPQSKVEDTDLIAALNEKLSDGGWVSYGYYSGTGTWDDGQMTPGDFMRYQDIVFDGIKYRAVIFDSYRPYEPGFTSNENNTWQDDNGYEAGTVYWFEFEPLEWRVLDPDNGLIICETIIDAQPYNNFVISADSEYWGDADKAYYPNNYAKGSIREWLNNDFINTAFSNEQKSNMKAESMNNDGYYTLTGTPGYEKYDAPSTDDKVFLLSYDDVLNSSYGFSTGTRFDPAREAEGSDYAKCQGLYVYIYSNPGYSYDGCSNWRLRSPGDDSHHSCVVRNDGFVCYNYSTGYSREGVRPSLKLQELKSDPTGAPLTIDPGMSLTYSPEEPVYLELATVTANLPSDAEGTVTFTFGGTTYTADVENGKAVCELLLDDNHIDRYPGAGLHDIKAEYSGDDKYSSVTLTGVVTIAQATPEINLTVSPENPIYGDSIIITAILHDSAVGKVTFTVTGENYNYTSDEIDIIDGAAQIELDSLIPGNYTVKADYSGGDDFNPGSKETTFTVGKIDPGMTVTVTPQNPASDGTFTLTVNLPDDATGNVIIRFNEVDLLGYIKLAEGNSQQFECLQSGRYSGTARYMPDDGSNYEEVTVDFSFNVSAAAPNMTLTAEDITYGETATVTANLPRDTMWGSVTFRLDGADTGKEVYVSQGKAVCTFADLNAGEHTVEAVFANDDKYADETKTITFNVAQKELTITANDQSYPFNNQMQGEDGTTYTNSADISEKVTVDDPVTGDTLTSIVLTGQAKDIDEYEGKIVPSSAVIKNSGGQNVTSNYDITYTAGKLTITSVNAPLTINYVYAKGGEAAETHTEDVEIFTGYSVTSPEITGYTPDKATVEGTMESLDGVTETVTYTPIEYTATFIDENGETVEAITFTVETESITEPAVPEKTNYTGKWEEYTLGTADITIKPIYTLGGETTVKAVDTESEITLGYKESKRFAFEPEFIPDGATAHVFYNGEDRGEGTSIEVKEPTDDYTVECKVLDKDGNEIATSGEIKVKVKNSFFDRLKWFFNNFWANILKTFIDALIAAC